MSDWREKIRTLTSAMGPTGDAVFAEIEEAVEAAIFEAKQDGAADERCYQGVFGE